MEKNQLVRDPDQLKILCINIMSKRNIVFIKLLKNHTNIDPEFIDTFFKHFKIGGELSFDIKDTDVAAYLKIKVKTLRKRLTSTYSHKEIFIEELDYVRVKNDTSSAGVTYMVNYECFERLAMMGKTEQAEVVRQYFIKLRRFLTDNQHLIFQAMEEKEDLKKYNGFETIYFFVIDERNPELIKIGHTTSIVQRLRNYNVGRIREVDLKYLAVVKNSLLIERCVKELLKGKQFRSNREIYRVEPEKIKRVIDECYCKHVSNENNSELYMDLSNLLGLYSYSKNKVHIKPYIIIGKDIK
jgi:phage anti-repressor protein